ncbi:SMAD/FHA domain-containing protein [Forsythia ovata]|uniref:SMAD/FHA domain-containing protein n=1 Tax=Forsythia ovata TaxID=205694 RepID=A0ABD1UDF1_9LAMI
MKNEKKLNHIYMNTSADNADSSGDLNNNAVVSVEKKQEQRNNNTEVPYTIPEWSGAPCHKFFIEVLKDGSIIDQFDMNEKGAYMFGRVEVCDFMLEHPTISRFHAVVQFKSNGDAYLYDLGSTHGTFINKNQVKKRVYVDLHVGDVIRFGQSSRLYIFQGPSDLMPPEADLKRIRNAKIQEDMKDMEASLLRAKLEASLADGISWGMREDAIEENEDEVDEITWQTYKGELTEKQEKTRDKVIKRLEKIAHMKKEIDAIRAKDIAQGGLTQGQQTQIARNEQRISQIVEELENLEETLNESIRESIGPRAGRTSHGKKKGAMEDDDDDYMSDDDEFYDRTQKPSKRRSGENQSIETADSLLDKKDAIVKEMEDKEKSLLDEDKMAQTNEVSEAGDALDAYMTAVSSQLVLDTKEKIHKELSVLQSQLDRILYLLKIADPTGEAARKRESKAKEPKPIVSESPASDSRKRPSSKKIQSLGTEGLSDRSSPKTGISDEAPESGKKPEESELVTNATKSGTTVYTDPTDNGTAKYTVAKPQWLGAVDDSKKQEIAREVTVDMQENDQFVDYKDRRTILKNPDSTQVNSGIEDAAPGLIIRKRKQDEKSKVSEVEDSGHPIRPEIIAEEAVALLLKHSRPINEDVPQPLESRVGKDQKKPKRVVGPERPSFLNDEPDYDSWIPPEGQSGDGRTSLNDRFGY